MSMICFAARARDLEGFLWSSDSADLCITDDKGLLSHLC